MSSRRQSNTVDEQPETGDEAASDEMTREVEHGEIDARVRSDEALQNLFDEDDDDEDFEYNGNDNAAEDYEDDDDVEDVDEDEDMFIEHYDFDDDDVIDIRYVLEYGDDEDEDDNYTADGLEDYDEDDEDDDEDEEMDEDEADEARRIVDGALLSLRRRLTHSGKSLLLISPIITPLLPPRLRLPPNPISDHIRDRRSTTPQHFCASAKRTITFAELLFNFVSGGRVKE